MRAHVVRVRVHSVVVCKRAHYKSAVVRPRTATKLLRRHCMCVHVVRTLMQSKLCTRVAPCRCTYSRTHYRGVVRVRVFYVPTCIPVCYMQRRCIRARALYLCVPARTPNCARSTRTLQRHCTCARDVRTHTHTNALRARTARGVVRERVLYYPRAHQTVRALRAHYRSIVRARVMYVPVHIPMFYVRALQRRNT